MSTTNMMDKVRSGLMSMTSGDRGDEINEHWHNEAVVHCGWLTKQGAKHKSWKRRWFSVRGYQMLYFKDPTDDKALGAITLADPSSKSPALTRKIEKLADDKRKHCFVIKGYTAEHRSYLLCADTLEELKTWMQVCTRVMYSPRGGGMFGCSLWDQVVKEGKGPDQLPIIASKCLAYLEERGLEEPGVFRLPGRSTRVEELVEAFNKGENPDISEEPEVHAIGSLLKRYLRELPTPLLSAERFTAFLSAAQVYDSNPAEGLVVIQQLIRDLPVCNAYLLRGMCEFLAKVAARSDVNKMDAHNLAVVFAPGFLSPPPDASPQVLVESTATSQAVTRMLIEHSKDAYALMPEPDQSVWRLFTNQKKNSASSLVKEFDIDDDDVTSSSGSTVVRKPSLPSDAVLSRADSIIASLPPLPNTASMPKRASADEVSAAGAQHELRMKEMQLELHRERSLRKSLETQVRVMRAEIAQLKEDLATEKVARIAITRTGLSSSPPTNTRTRTSTGSPLSPANDTGKDPSATPPPRLKTHNRTESNPFL
eukprot:m.190993 g.190993  ORF g.190993 m.190993 type:complete len:538 (+) comp18581_c0_seq2:338-1951(+)